MNMTSLCTIRLTVVLMMCFSSSVFIIFFTNYNLILHVSRFTARGASHQIDYHYYVRWPNNPCSNSSQLVHYNILWKRHIVKHSSWHSIKSQEMLDSEHQYNADKS